MKIINNKDPLIDVRNQICFLWDSVITGIECMNLIGDLYVANSHKYVLDEDSVDDLKSLVNHIFPKLSKKFFNLLETRSNVEIEEHLEFMDNYSKDTLNRVNKNINLIRNKNSKDRVEIGEESLLILIELKEKIEGFRSRFEFV